MKTEKFIYLIPYAHLDTQWRWEYPTTIKEYIKNTINDNIALLQKYPDYRFNFTGAIRYEMMKEYYPEGFERVKKYVREGRWLLAGTCLDETDAIVPSVESMIRNILYGNEWQKKEFNQSSCDYMLPDCFGFPANMPTVLKHCGIVGFSTQKLTWGSAVGIPFNIGKWLGPDGSQLLCAFDPGAYVDQLKTPVQESKIRVEKLNALGAKTGVFKTLQYYGVGDVGGAPQESSAINAIISEKNSINSEITVKQTTGSDFFNSFSGDETDRLQEYMGDLLLTNHSAGSISSQSIMKRWNRQNEQLAFVAEYCALLAEKIAGLEYPYERISKAWKKVIGNQMHDILPGTCTPTAYEYSYNDEILALKEWSKIIEDSVSMIAPFIKGEGNILIMNPFEYKRRTVCEIIMDSADVRDNCCLVDKEGNRFYAQTRRLDNDKVLLTAEVTLEAFEIKRFALADHPMDGNDLSLKKNSGDIVLENKYLKLCVNMKGEIYSLVDKTRNCEMFAKPLSYHLQKESPKEYPAWNMDWKDRKLPPHQIISQGDVRIIEDGAVRKTLEITTKLNHSILIKEISLAANSQTIDFIERIQWREKGGSLKLALSPKISNPICAYNWETCLVERPINHEKQFEVPSRYFADIKNEQGGIAILENCKYGYDHPDDETLRLTLLYTPKPGVKTGFNDQRHQDFGSHTIKYALYPHKSDGNVDLAAKSFNRGLRAYQTSTNRLDCSSESVNRLLELDGENLGVLAIKKAESRKGIIVRLYNRKKIDTTANLKFLIQINAIYEVDGIEENIRELSIADGSTEINLKANAIISLLIVTPQPTCRCALQKNVLLDGAKILDLFPKELIGNAISSGNITFHLSGEDVTAISCEGQKLDIENNMNTLSLLVCTDSQSHAEIRIFDQNAEEIQREAFTVFPAQGYAGQFDQRRWLFPINHAKNFKRDYVWMNKYIGLKNGWIRPSKICWYTSHTHQDNNDLYYQHGYLEQIDVSLPRNARYVLLPQNASIKVLAATFSDQQTYVKNITNKTDKYEF